MSRPEHALAGGAATVAGSNLTWVIVVAVIALCALGVAGVLVREVLAASQGTQKMREISQAVQEGAAAVVLIFKSNAPSVLEGFGFGAALLAMFMRCLLYTSPSPRDRTRSRMPSSA